MPARKHSDTIMVQVGVRLRDTDLGSRGRPAPLARPVPARPATPARPRRMAAESSNLKELSRRSDLLPINGLCYCSD